MLVVLVKGVMSGNTRGALELLGNMVVPPFYYAEGGETC